MASRTALGPRWFFGQTRRGRRIAVLGATAIGLRCRLPKGIEIGTDVDPHASGLPFDVLPTNRVLRSSLVRSRTMSAWRWFLGSTSSDLWILEACSWCKGVFLTPLAGGHLLWQPVLLVAVTALFALGWLVGFSNKTDNGFRNIVVGTFRSRKRRQVHAPRDRSVAERVWLGIRNGTLFALMGPSIVFSGSILLVLVFGVVEVLVRAVFLPSAPN